MDELLLWDSAVNADDNPYPATTGSDVQSQLGRMKARLVARYRLAAVPGRPEELIRPWSTQAVSLGYGCKTIRVRTMIGREWIGYRDFQIREGWQIELDELGDEHFGAPNPTPATMDRRLKAGCPRCGRPWDRQDIKNGRPAHGLSCHVCWEEEVVKPKSE